MPYVNRSVVVVRPGQRFVDWVHGLDEEDGVEPAEASSIRGATIAYLAPEVETPGDVERFLKKKARTMFEELLEGWCVDREKWPKQRGIKSFEKWVEWEVHDFVVDLDDAPLVSDASADSAGFVDEPFDFHAALHDPDGYISETLGPVWIDQLYEAFEMSPEADRIEGPLGWTRSLFDYLHSYESLTIHDVTPELLEYALLVHFPRKVLDPFFDGEEVVAEFIALFEFMKRAYRLKPADACLSLLRRRGMADDMDEAMNAVENFGMAKRVMAGLDPFGGGGFAPIQHPFVSNEPEVGRNDACPCGSGKKYKRCCLKKA